MTLDLRAHVTEVVEEELGVAWKGPRLRVSRYGRRLVELLVFDDQLDLRVVFYFERRLTLPWRSHNQALKQT